MLRVFSINDEAKRRGLKAMDSEVTLLNETLLADRSPVDVFIDIQKDLAEFRQNGGKKAFRERARAELREACKAALSQTGDRSTYPDVTDIVAYLEDRGLIKASRRNRKAT
jgi:hypothetical protein